MEQFLGGLEILAQWQNFLVIPLGLAIGIVVGAIPGLTSDLGLILCIPLTYSMDPTMAILMLLAIYCGAAVIRMCNWTQNDTYRSAGDAAYGTILEITFLYAMLLPCVYLTGMVWKAPFLIVFACCYIDEPIRFVLMQIHLFSGKWIKPVTPQGREALAEFFEKRRAARRRAA